MSTAQLVTAWVAFWIGFVLCLFGVLFFDVRDHDAALRDCPPLYDGDADGEW